MKQFFKMFLVMAAFLFGGMKLGLMMTDFFTQGNPLAGFLGFFIFPLSFSFGLIAWKWTALAVLLPSLIKLFYSDKGHRAKVLRDIREKQLPGTRILVIVSTMTCFIISIPIGLFARSMRFILVITAYTMTGFFYGMLLKKAAQAGLLHPPE